MLNYALTRLADTKATAAFIEKHLKNVQTQRFSRDSRLTWVDNNGKTNLSENGLIENPKPYVHRPSENLRNIRGHKTQNPTDLGRILMSNETDSLARVVAYEDSLKQRRNGAVEYRISDSDLEKVKSAWVQEATTKEKVLRWLGYGNPLFSSFVNIHNLDYRPGINLKKDAQQVYFTVMSGIIGPAVKTGNIDTIRRGFDLGEKTFEGFYDSAITPITSIKK